MRRLPLAHRAGWILRIRFDKSCGGALDHVTCDRAHLTHFGGQPVEIGVKLDTHDVLLP
jgi:hypothetical protein